MMISHVTFSASPEEDAKIQLIMRNKLDSARSAEGIISAECWRKNEPDSSAYSLVTKWESEKYFRAWMSASHAGKPRPSGGDKLQITKTATHYEYMDWDSPAK